MQNALSEVENLIIVDIYRDAERLGISTIHRSSPTLRGIVVGLLSHSLDPVIFYRFFFFFAFMETEKKWNMLGT